METYTSRLLPFGCQFARLPTCSGLSPARGNDNDAVVSYSHARGKGFAKMDNRKTFGEESFISTYDNLLYRWRTALLRGVRIKGDRL